MAGGYDTMAKKLIVEEGKTKKVKVVSLFSGIGGFEEGLRESLIDYEVVLASEIDQYARKSYLANFPDTKLLGDVKLINEKDVPQHDLLLAGFPCQSFSIAGMRKGFDDIRGTLFFDVARILNEKKPKYILLENVKNLISHDDSKTIHVILNTLNDIGYTVDFSVVNSSDAGVPQNRDRTYILGIYEGLTEKFENDQHSSKIARLKQELNGTDFRGFNFFNRMQPSREMKSIEDIMEQEVEPSFYLNKEQVRDYLAVSDIFDVEYPESRIIKLFDLPKEIHNDLERQRRVYSVKGISPTVLARTDSTKIMVEKDGRKAIRKITPTENFYIQGFGREFVENIKKTGMSKTQMYKQSGNAVSPPIIRQILDVLYKEYMIKQ